MSLTVEQQILVSQYMDQADRCAKWWRRRDKQIDFEDFRQEALFGLIRAAINYQPEVNKASFTTYAYTFMHGAVKKMRSEWYTGKKHGFEEKAPIPIWVLLDHPNEDEGEDEGNWYAKHCGVTFFNPVLREQLSNLQIETVEDKKLEQQKEITKYLTDVKCKMKEDKISITALAKKIGVSQPTLSRWLNNTVGLNEESRKRIDSALI